MNPNCAARTGPTSGPGPAMAAKWWPKTTQRFVGTKSRPSSRTTAGVARISSSVRTRAASHEEWNRHAIRKTQTAATTTQRALTVSPRERARMARLPAPRMATRTQTKAASGEGRGFMSAKGECGARRAERKAGGFKSAWEPAEGRGFTRKSKPGVMTFPLFEPSRQPPPGTKLTGRLCPSRIPKLKTRTNQPRRHNIPAFQDQLRFRPQKEGAYLEHPPGSGQANPRAPRRAQTPHEFRIRQRMGRTQINRAAQRLMFDKPGNGADKVQLMDPRYVLTAIAMPASQPKSNQPQQHIKRSTGIRTHHDRRAHQDQPRARQSPCLFRRLFPGLRHIDTEPPSVRRPRFRSPQDPPGLIIRRIESMLIDRRRTGLEPHAGRMVCLRDRLPDHPC